MNSASVLYLLLSLLALSAVNSQTVRCGKDWADANSRCASGCQLDADCPAGARCFASLSSAPCSGANSATGTRCGGSWADANGKCGANCKTNADCPGSFCFAALSMAPCGGSSSPPPPPPPPSSSGGARCGASWEAANSQCGTSCSTDAQCSGGSRCYKDLSPCSSPSNPPSITPPPSSGGGGGCGFVVSNADLQFIMQSSADFSRFVGPLNAALKRYNMDCIQRIAVFLAQVRHETAGLTIFHQPADNGAGTLHMTPSNWNALCQGVPDIKQAFASKFPNCGNCECTSTMAANQFSADTTRAAKEIFAAPNIAFLSGTWWFAQGSSLASTLGWKGCGDLRLDSDVGLGAPGGSDCRHTGYYQVTCCVFWTIGGSAGMSQRITYYDVAERWMATNAVRAVFEFEGAAIQDNSQLSVTSPAPALYVNYFLFGLVLLVGVFLL